MLKINCEIMSKDRAVASVRGGVLADADPALLPLFLKRTRDVEAWLEGRANVQLHAGGRQQTAPMLQALPERFRRRASQRRVLQLKVQEPV